MGNAEKRNSFIKFWPVWLIIIAVAALMLINAGKRGSVPDYTQDQSSQASGKVLSKVDPEQFLSASWFGKKCPDFTVTTLEGKQLTLSSLAVKQVMLVCWATWCPPCRAEIPDIIELRGMFAADKLEIIGVSFEGADVVRQFVAGKNINYTIATASPEDMPVPFGSVRAFPSAFFIDAKGNLKIAVEGSITMQQMKGIIEAE